MTPGVEVIYDNPANSVAVRFMNHFREASPKWASASSIYTGTKKVCVVYGPGDPKRLVFLNKHKERGGRIVCWDKAYWDRKDGMRLSIDEFHPKVDHIDLYPGTPRRGFILREDANPKGPIMLVGLGPKSNVAYNYGEMEWERKKLAELVTEFPGTRIRWRPKRLPITLKGTDLCFGGDIEVALKGCSLVVCRHSNVAVDACIAGIPVRCQDGAALYLYRHGENPSELQRIDFLHKLTWWEWNKAQLKEAWSWILQVIERTGGGA